MAQNDEQPAFEFDLDALQAQINMAMAETEELVSSWVQPSKRPSQRPKRSIEEMEKELQEYLRRPPRLGVGAPIPEPVGPSAQEEAKLKNKLVGNSKKRSREEAVELSKREEMNEEDESVDKKGESSSSSKLVRVDPFSLPKKKAKRKADTSKNDFNVNATTSSAPIPIVNGVTSSSSVLGLPVQAGTSAIIMQTTKLNDEPDQLLMSVATTSSDTNTVRPLSSDSRSSVPILNGISNQASTSIQETYAQKQLMTPESPTNMQPISDVPSSPTSAKKKKKKKKKEAKVEEAQTNGVVDLPSSSPKARESSVSIAGDERLSTAIINGANGDVNDIVNGLSVSSSSSTAPEPAVAGTTIPNGPGTADNIVTEAEDQEEEEWTGFDDSVLLEGLGEPGSSGLLGAGEQVIPSIRIQTNLNVKGAPPFVVSRPTPSSTSAPKLGPPRKLPPLLNLTGPPVPSSDRTDSGNDNANGNDNNDDSTQSPSSPSSPSKKKRKRRRKNKQQLRQLHLQQQQQHPFGSGFGVSVNGNGN